VLLAAGLLVLSAVLYAISPLSGALDTAGEYSYQIIALVAYLAAIVAVVGVHVAHRGRSRSGWIGSVVPWQPSSGMPSSPPSPRSVSSGSRVPPHRPHRGGGSRVCHGAISLFQGLFLGGIDDAGRYWLLTAPYGVAAAGLAFALRTGSSTPVTASFPPVTEA
jgi:hypothetical protein